MVSDYSGLHNNDEFLQYLVERYVLLIEQHTNRRKGLSFDKDSILFTVHSWPPNIAPQVAGLLRIADHCSSTSRSVFPVVRWEFLPQDSPLCELGPVVKSVVVIFCVSAKMLLL